MQYLLGLIMLIKTVADAPRFLGHEASYTIDGLFNKDIALLTFKAYNEITPNFLCSFIYCHSYNRRRAAKNKVKTKFGMRTLHIEHQKFEMIYHLIY